MYRLIHLFLISILVSWAGADTVIFKSGLEMEGKVEDKGDTIKIITANGFTEVPKSIIARIKKTDVSLRELKQKQKQKQQQQQSEKKSYFEKAREWYNIYLWAVKEGYPVAKQKQALQRVLKYNPNHPDANRALQAILKEEAQAEIDATTPPPGEIIEKKPKDEPVHYRTPEAALEAYVDSLYPLSFHLPVDNFAERGGLNVLYSFIYRKAKKQGFSHLEAQRIANENKNIAALGGGRARDALRRIYASILRLYTRRDPNNFHVFGGRGALHAVNRDQFIFAIEQAARAAAGGDSASVDFDDTYGLVYHKLYDSYYMGISSDAAYRIAVKTAAIVASGGGYDSFRRAFGYHFRQARQQYGSRQKAVPYAIRQALEENKYPKKTYRNDER